MLRLDCLPVFAAHAAGDIEATLHTRSHQEDTLCSMSHLLLPMLFDACLSSRLAEQLSC